MENSIKLRRALGLGQTRLAKLSGVSRARLQGSEANLLELHADERAQIFAVLKRAARSLQTYLDETFGARDERQQAMKT